MKLSKKAKDITGHRFSLLSVESPVSINKNGTIIWQCRCDCGKEVKAIGTRLRNGVTKSCASCAHRGKSQPARWAEPGVRGFNQAYGTYKHVAKKKGRAFVLTKDEFRELVTSNCHYCGAVPSRVAKAHYASTAERSSFLYNGIDRRDNERGYEKDNCLPCCYTCNRAKRELSYKEFTEWLQTIANFWGFE